MKLLKVQLNHLQQELDELHQKLQTNLNHMKEFERSMQRMDSTCSIEGNEETRVYQEELESLRFQIAAYQELLNQGQLITHFDNNRIALGTKFILQFALDDCEEYTLIETNIGVSTLEGYITLNSPIGQCILGKMPGESFAIEFNHHSIQGVVQQIIPQEDLPIEQPKMEAASKVKTTVEPKKKEKKNAYFAPRHRCKKFEEYYHHMKENINCALGRREVFCIQNLTLHQKEYLEKYVQEISKQCLEKNFRNSNERNAYVLKRRYVKEALKKESYQIKNYRMTQLSQNVICEIKGNEEAYVKEGELVPHIYGDEDEHGFITIRQFTGFYAYRMAMGETVKIPNKKLFLRVAQFGIKRENLLYPLSANLTWTSYSPEEQETNASHTLYQEKKHLEMTPSQEKLYQQELMKIENNENESPYLQYLLALKEKLKQGSITVLSEEELAKNQDTIGLGSQISYVLYQNGEETHYQQEMIACAYTVEEKQHYVEKCTSIGSVLFGKRAGDTFVVVKDGKELLGSVESCTAFSKPVSIQEEKAPVYMRK